MEIKEFAIKVQAAISKKLGEDYTVKLQEVSKNNGVMLQGLLILAEEKNITPTIYLNSFWEAYEQGMPFAVIVKRILQIYREDTPKENVDMSFFKEFDKVKDRICFRLISAERNGELLTKIPHIRYMDMAICFFYSYQGEVLGNGSILIYHTHLDMWQTSVEELYELAEKNTPKLYHWESTSMEEAVKEMLEKRDSEEMDFGDFFQIMPMQVLSNESRVNGAACILYPKLLKTLAEAVGKNLYIIPCSIHEVIILQDSGAEDALRLQETIKEVNRTQVEPEEILSDNLYYYNRFLDQLKIF